MLHMSKAVNEHRLAGCKTDRCTVYAVDAACPALQKTAVSTLMSRKAWLIAHARLVVMLNYKAKTVAT